MSPQDPTAAKRGSGSTKIKKLKPQATMNIVKVRSRASVGGEGKKVVCVFGFLV